MSEQTAPKKPSKLEVVEIIRIDARRPSGGRNAENPAFDAVTFWAGVDAKVVLKVENGHRIAKELIAAWLAEVIGLPHAPGAIAAVADDQLSMLDGAAPARFGERRYAYVSRFVDASPLGVRDEDMLRSHFALKLLAFDQLIANFDRDFGNVLARNGQYWAFDHDKILFRDQPDWCGLPVDEECHSMMTDDIMFAQPSGSNAAEVVAVQVSDTLAAMEFDLLDQLVEEQFLIPEERDCLSTYFRERAVRLPALVRECFKW